MIPQLRDGQPTGRINDKQMEINLYVPHPDGSKTMCGTRWIDITEEQRQKIMGANNVVVSVGASVEQVEAARATEVNVSPEGHASFSRRFDAEGKPALTACVAASGIVDRTGHYFDPEVMERFMTSNIKTNEPRKETSAEQLARIAQLDKQLFRPPTGHSQDSHELIQGAGVLSPGIRERLSKIEVVDLKGLNIDSWNLTSDGIQPRGTVQHAAAMHPDGPGLADHSTDAAPTDVTGTTTMTSLLGSSTLVGEVKFNSKLDQLQYQLRQHEKNPRAVPAPTWRAWLEAAGFSAEEVATQVAELAKEKENPQVARQAPTLAEYGIADAPAGTFPVMTMSADSKVTVADSTIERRATTREHSGGNVNYYSIEIKHPKRPDRKPYIFEVEDLIQAANMTFQEGTVLKSLFRSVMEREFGIGKVGGDYIRDAEKMVHSSQEVLRARKIAKDKS